ncbi:hypothetical protein, partial [Streptomyces avermitilis]|uniref:hypothetical protein n=1 Tax=Streptomyces avermitilis TaxID=33903 RepID=UPI0038264B4B
PHDSPPHPRDHPELAGQLSQMKRTTKNQTLTYTQDRHQGGLGDRSHRRGAAELGQAGHDRLRAGAPGELTSAKRVELRRLRRQNLEQAETIEVLRKAAVFFAKESDC